MGVVQLVAGCVVHVSAAGARGGSGFLVASGKVLTCAQVVAGRPGTGVRIGWRGWELPGQAIDGPDLVALRLAGGSKNRFPPT